MVTVLQTALQNHSGLTEIRAPDGAMMKYESRDQIIKALKYFSEQVAKETAGTGSCQIYKLTHGATR
jgi:hypothetical protein